MEMAVNISWTGFEMWAQVFFFIVRCYDTEPIQKLWYCSIATKRAMIQFTAVPPDASYFFMAFIIRHQSYMEPASAGSDFKTVNF